MGSHGHFANKYVSNIWEFRFVTELSAGFSFFSPSSHTRRVERQKFKNVNKTVYAHMIMFLLSFGISKLKLSHQIDIQRCCV